MSGSEHGNKNWLYNLWVKWCPMPKIFGIKAKTCTHKKYTPDPTKECCDSPVSSDNHEDDCSDNIQDQIVVPTPDPKPTSKKEDTLEKPKKSKPLKKKTKKKPQKAKK